MKKAIIIILTVLLAASAAFCWWLASFVMTGKRQTLDESLSWQSERYDTSFYEHLDKTDYTVESFDGYVLHAQLLENPEKTDRFVILSHSYTDNRMGCLKYVPMYLDLGFNCIIYDLRGHGENEPTFTTYGVREGEDLAYLIADTRKRYSDLTVLGLHGESFGAATTVFALGYRPEVDFAVADCGYSDIENVLKNGYKNAHLPEFLFEIADFAGALRYGYRLSQMRPIDALDENEVPILFLHGEADTLVLPKNSEDMATRTKGYSEVHLIPAAGHAESIFYAPYAYRNFISYFLQIL